MLVMAGGTDRAAALLEAGQVTCPACGTAMRPWGWGRERVVRRAGAYERLRPRRGRCPACGITHVLLPDRTLLRRLDDVEAVGAALVLTARGSGHRSVARRLLVPPTTVRRWIGRYAELHLATAGAVRGAAALRVAVGAGHLDLSGEDGPHWPGVSRRTGGRLLSPRPPG